METTDTPIIPKGIKYKCPLCDFTYIWLNTIEDNKLANDHVDSHVNKPILFSYIEVVEEPTVIDVILNAVRIA